MFKYCMLFVVWLLSACFVAVPADEELADYQIPIDQSQNVDDVTVNLRWAYSEGGRITVGLSPLVADETGKMQPLEYKGIEARLREANGAFIGYSREGSIDTRQNEMMLVFELPPEVQLPETLDLVLEVVFPTQPEAALSIPTWVDYVETGVELLRLNTIPRWHQRAIALIDYTRQQFPRLLFTVSVVSFRTMGGAYQLGITEVLAMPVPEEGVGVFTFAFSLPVRDVIEVTVKETINAAEIPITLERVSIAPSAVEAFVCVTLAPDGRGWELDLELLANDQHYPGYGTRFYVADDPRRCFNIFFNLPMPIDASEYTLKIQALEDYDVSYEDWLKIQRMVKDDGITITLNDFGGGISFRYPPGQETDAPLNAAKVELGYRIEGDWTFVVELP